MTDNKKIAEQVLRAVGGAANLKDAHPLHDTPAPVSKGRQRPQR